MTIRELKKGEYFTTKPYDYPKESQVYVRGEYDRSIKKYCCYQFSDINNEKTFKGDKVVYTDFIF